MIGEVQRFETRGLEIQKELFKGLRNGETEYGNTAGKEPDIY